MLSSLSFISAHLAALIFVLTLIYGFTNYNFGVERGSVLIGGGFVSLILLAISHLLIIPR